jgi:hypothetical protein
VKGKKPSRKKGERLLCQNCRSLLPVSATYTKPRSCQMKPMISVGLMRVALKIGSICGKQATFAYLSLSMGMGLVVLEKKGTSFARSTKFALTRKVS